MAETLDEMVEVVKGFVGDSGVCSNDRAVKAINQARRLLWNKREWNSTAEYVEICCADCCFTLPNRYGNPKKISFTDLVFKQNVVMFLWTTDCPLCKLEVRHMNELVKWAEKHPKANLRVVSVNFGDDGKDGFEAAGWDEVMMPKFEVLWDPGARRFKADVWQLDKHGIPITFFFAQGGFPVRVIPGFTADLIKTAQEEFLPPERVK